MLIYKTKLIFDNQKVKDFWIGQMTFAKACYNHISKVAFEEHLPL